MMFSKKKNFIILISSIIITGMICSLIVYFFTSQTQKIKTQDLYGTYRLNTKNIDDTEYLAVIPSLSSDPTKNINQFQWYNTEKEMIAQGSCEINREGYITLDVDGNRIGILFINSLGKYYFINDTLEIQEIIKISEEPMVNIPLDK